MSATGTHEERQTHEFEPTPGSECGYYLGGNMDEAQAYCAQPRDAACHQAVGEQEVREYPCGCEGSDSYCPLHGVNPDPEPCPARDPAERICVLLLGHTGMHRTRGGDEFGKLPPSPPTTTAGQTGEGDEDGHLTVEAILESHRPGACKHCAGGPQCDACILAAVIVSTSAPDTAAEREAGKTVLVPVDKLKALQGERDRLLAHFAGNCGACAEEAMCGTRTVPHEGCVVAERDALRDRLNDAETDARDVRSCWNASVADRDRLAARVGALEQRENQFNQKALELLGKPFTTGDNISLLCAELVKAEARATAAESESARLGAERDRAEAQCRTEQEAVRRVSAERDAAASQMLDRVRVSLQEWGKAGCDIEVGKAVEKIVADATSSLRTANREQAEELANLWRIYNALLDHWTENKPAVQYKKRAEAAESANRELVGALEGLVAACQESLLSPHCDAPHGLIHREVATARAALAKGRGE